MKYRIVVLSSAKQDARAIDDYLTEQNPAVAERFLQNLQATLELQAAIPTPGSPWVSDNPSLAELRWTRVKRFRHYLVFLRLLGADMQVVRILHSSQDLEAALSR